MSLQDLYSLLPSTTPPVSPLPSLHTPAPTHTLLPSSITSHPTLLAFVRHCGCPFGESDVRSLARVLNEDEGKGGRDLRVVVVCMSEEKEAKEWWDAVGGKDFHSPSRVTLTPDPTRTLYTTFGLSLLPFTGLFSLPMLSSLKQLKSIGIVNTETKKGSHRWQNHGGFAIAKGEGREVKWRFVAKHAGELADWDEARRSLME